MTAQTRVLIVDDNNDLLETFSIILKRRGFHVTTAINGAVAVDKFREQSFDITLMDIVMPEMNGVEAFRKMREIDPSARVILMTAYSEQELIKKALQEGAFCVVNKPLPIDYIIALLKEATEGGSVLVVDDDEDVLHTMKNSLEGAGYRVRTAASGEEAVVVASKDPCSVVFIDMKLPIMNGLETFLRLKGVNPNITAVMMTGYRDEAVGEIEAALAASADSCLYKPFSPQKALAAIKRLTGEPKPREGVNV